jgi:hypothetical protein
MLDKSEGYSLVHLYRHLSDKKPEWRIRRANRVAVWVDGSQKQRWREATGKGRGQEAGSAAGLVVSVAAAGGVSLHMAIASCNGRSVAGYGSFPVKNLSRTPEKTGFFVDSRDLSPPLAIHKLFL